MLEEMAPLRVLRLMVEEQVVEDVPIILVLLVVMEEMEEPLRRAPDFQEEMLPVGETVLAMELEAVVVEWVETRTVQEPQVKVVMAEMVPMGSA